MTTQFVCPFCRVVIVDDACSTRRLEEREAEDDKEICNICFESPEYFVVHSNSCSNHLCEYCYNRSTHRIVPETIERTFSIYEHSSFYELFSRDGRCRIVTENILIRMESMVEFDYSRVVLYLLKVRDGDDDIDCFWVDMCYASDFYHPYKWTLVRRDNLMPYVGNIDSSVYVPMPFIDEECEREQEIRFSRNLNIWTVVYS